MKIRIEPYREEMTDAVRAFNRRLDAAGTEHAIRIPEHSMPALLPKRAGDGFGQECFIALEDRQVRGGYILYHQIWSIAGRRHLTGNCMRPISEGVINRSYGMVGLQLIHDAMRRQPLQFGLGLGVDGPQTRVLKAMRWDIWPVPFFFKVLNARAFLRNFQPLRRNRGSALLMDFLAASGLARLGSAIASVVLTESPDRPLYVEQVENFTGWADQLFQECSVQYSALEVRDSAILNALFCDRPEFVCLRVFEEGRAIGWAVIDAVTNNHARFGDMKVRSILDCLAKPSDALPVVQAVSGYIADQGADLIISNQSHPAWRKALRRAGFFPGPSTFLFASVPALTKVLNDADPQRRGLHFTRGGGDVPLTWEPPTRFVSRGMTA